MPSDERGRGNPNSSSGPPSVGVPPSSSQPPPAEVIAWGPVRDAVTSLHNLEVLLKSPRVAPKVLAGLLPEISQGARVLRTAFTAAAQSAALPSALSAREGLAVFASARLDELDEAMRRASASELDTRGRLALEQAVTRVAVDLNACAELLDLSERAEHPVPAELALDELVWVSIHGGPRGAEPEVPLRLVPHRDECTLRVDPHIFKRLLAFAVGRLHAAGAPYLTLRVARESAVARVEIRATTPEEMSLEPSAMRLARRIAPTDAVVAAAAGSAGIESTQEDGAIVLRVARVS
jgi:hypothetical protein